MPRLARIIVLFLLIAARGPSSPAQTKWFKYEGNPVLDVGPAGSWDNRWAGGIRVIIHDSVYQMWYAGADDHRKSLGYATSVDGIRWTKHPASPVLTPDPTSWDSRESHMGYVTRTGSAYRIWYAGGDGQTYLRIGSAQSPDGIKWVKAPTPVLGGTSPLDSVPLNWPCVLESDRGGTLKMWFNTLFDSDVRASVIGYAERTNSTSWTIQSESALLPGGPELWDGGNVRIPRVIHSGNAYEMWYSGSKTNAGDFQAGYATSRDGIHWTKSLDNPVLSPGPEGSWDGDGVFAGDVVYDEKAKMYSMWYVGSSDERKVRTGFAVSPKGYAFSVSPTGDQRGTVRLSVSVEEPHGLTFLARIMALQNAQRRTENPPGSAREADLVELFDDGRHEDGLPSDGLFSNIWNAPEENIHFVDLKMGRRNLPTSGFEMRNAAVFATTGPVKLDSVIFAGDGTRNPGDTVLVKLVLRNDGAATAATWITASLSPADAWTRDAGSLSPSYGHIYAGTTVVTSGYYRLHIDPNCPPETEVKVNVTIASSGIPLWNDAFVFRVGTPWWRSDWAYGLYAMLFVGLLITLRQLDRKRTRLRHLREMEHFQAQKLKELDQLKSRFFANISHEFRTPLTLIEGPLKQLKSGEFDGNRNEQYDMMLRNTQRLERLVNQLLDLSRIESGTMKLRVEKTDIVELVRGTASAFESFAKSKRVQYTITTPADSIVGWFDRDAIEKVVTNLLSNAFKFTAEGGKVGVHIRIPNSEIHNAVEITVFDTGTGIPSDQLDKVFDRFYQVDASQTREQEGTGIGLALTKELVDLHNGRITVTSELGRGSTFRIELPLGKDPVSDDEIAHGERARIKDTEPVLESERTEALEIEDEGAEVDETLPLLLIVEDNADMRKHIRSHLENQYRLSEAVNGEEGLHKAIESIPDLVISDVMMPTIDGIELCKRLKTDERTSHIPVILLTAKAGPDHKLEGLETGADDYLIKPFDAKELIVRAKNLIEQRLKLRDRFRREIVLEPRNSPVTSMDERFLGRAKEIVHEHLSDTGFGVELFAEEMALSRSQLHRKLYALTGIAPGDFIRSIRLLRAAVLIKNRFGSVSQIAYEVGFSNPSHFTEAFRKQFGKTPSDFAKQYS